MKDIYQSPQSGMRREISQDHIVTQNMIEGLGKGRKWAKYIAYVCYLYGAMMVIGVVALFGVAITGTLPALMKEEFALMGLDKTIITLILLVAAVVLGVLVSYMFRMGRSMKMYSRAVNELYDSREFSDLEACFKRFTDYNRYLVISSFGLILIIIAIVIAMIVGANS